MIDINMLVVTTSINIVCLIVGVLVTLAVLNSFTE